MVVKDELKKLGLHYTIVDLGMVDVFEEITSEQRELLKANLLRSGLELLDDKKSILIEKIKNVIIEMIHYSEELPKVNYSDHISEKLNHDYTYLSNTFSEVKGITIQQYIIFHKIERVKELLLYDELTLTEISYRMQYSAWPIYQTSLKKLPASAPPSINSSNKNAREPSKTCDFCKLFPLLCNDFRAKMMQFCND